MRLIVASGARSDANTIVCDPPRHVMTISPGCTPVATLSTSASGRGSSVTGTGRVGEAEGGGELVTRPWAALAARAAAAWAWEKQMKVIAACVTTSQPLAYTVAPHQRVHEALRRAESPSDSEHEAIMDAAE